jgi:hypothetical protein
MAKTIRIIHPERVTTAAGRSPIPQRGPARSGSAKWMLLAFPAVWLLLLLGVVLAVVAFGYLQGLLA